MAARADVGVGDVGVCAVVDGDGTFAAVQNMNDGAARVFLVLCDVFGVDVVFAQRVVDLHAVKVTTRAADQIDASAELRNADRLIEALSAGDHLQCLCGDRLPELRQERRADVDVHMDAADHKNVARRVVTRRCDGDRRDLLHAVIGEGAVTLLMLDLADEVIDQETAVFTVRKDDLGIGPVAGMTLRGDGKQRKVLRHQIVEPCEPLLQ